MKSQKSKGLRLGSGGGHFGAQGSGSSLSCIATPPDVSRISDPNVAIWFRNLLRKDSTTRTKALEELVAFAAAHPFEKDGGVEDGILDVWIELYPRASIDSYRRVRELSHVFQLGLMKSARKRMERHLPKVVGSWLAGLYDRDRAVSRAAHDGLSSFLNTPEKAAQFWKKCQPHVLDFALSAVQETKETLSDERITTKEDAEAKHFRVVNAAIALICSLLTKLKPEDADSCQDKYDLFFDERRVFEAISLEDAQVRKGASQLILVCLGKRKPLLEGRLSRLKKDFVYSGLKGGQTGSAMDFAKCLTALAAAFPDMWKLNEESKDGSGQARKGKDIFACLFRFLKSGSQQCPPQYWDVVGQLIKTIPTPPSVIFDLAQNFRSGVENEAGIHATGAWTSFVRVCGHLVPRVIEESRVQFGSTFLRPLLTEWISAREAKDGAARATRNTTVAEECYFACQTDAVLAAAAEGWIGDVVSQVCNGMQAAAEQEKEAAARSGERWFDLVGRVQQNTTKPDGTQLGKFSDKMIKSCCDAVVSTPRSHTAPMRVVRRAVGTTNFLRTRPELAAPIFSLLTWMGETHMGLILSSPSRADFLAIFEAFGAELDPVLVESYQKVWRIWIQALLGVPDMAGTWPTVAALISSESGASLAEQDEAVKEYVFGQCRRCIETEHGEWLAFELAAKRGYQGNELLRLCLDLLDSHTTRALHGLAIISRHAKMLSDADALNQAHKRMLLLTERSDKSVSGIAEEILFLLDQADGERPTAAILEENLEDAGPHSLSVSTLVGLAQDSDEEIANLLPRASIWRQVLDHMLTNGINPSLSITSPLGGAQYVVGAARDETASTVSVSYDSRGHSVPIRMAMYAAKILEDQVTIDQVSTGPARDVLVLLLATAHIASDELTLMRGGKLFESMSPANQDVTEHFVTSVRRWLKTLVEDVAAEAFFNELLDHLMGQSDNSPLGYYVARVLGEIVEALTEVRGSLRGFDALLAAGMGIWKDARNPLPASALTRGIGQVDAPDALDKACNSLVSDVMAAKPDPEKSMPHLVLLTSALGCYADGEVPVQMNRLVFAVKNLTSWFESDDELDLSLAAQTLRLLQRLLPAISSVYGPHWEATLAYCANLWSNAGKHDLDDVVPAIHASIKLLTVLEGLDDANDDLEDALKQFAQAKTSGLIAVMKLPREFPLSQPVEIIDALICRQIQKAPIRLIKDYSVLYELVGSKSTEIQTAAFSVLHQAIPAAQQQISVDALLDKKRVDLPAGLLAPLANAPTLEKYDTVLSQFPPSLRSHLLTWLLVFDSYGEASLGLRSDYTDSLKAQQPPLVAPLLDFLCDVLGHSVGNPLRLDRAGLGEEQIRAYDIRIADGMSPEESMHWLLVHIFYLVLKYVPELFRHWYEACRVKQTKLAVEQWMGRYFSPLVVADVLDDVARWAAHQDVGKDEQALSVKVSRPGREVTAGYELGGEEDDEVRIAIRLPKLFPLENVTVEGTKRASGVREKMFEYWVRATQAVLTLRQGSVVDGLLAFRRSVAASLRGQSECVICYSVLLSDRNVPEKRCATCKNAFHRHCLYKWAQTSMSNTCPLCRSPMDRTDRGRASGGGSGARQGDQWWA